MKIKNQIGQEIIQLVTLKQAASRFEIATLASLAVGIPLLIGYFLNQLSYGVTASLAGMVILYLPREGAFTNRIVTLLISSFGFMAAYTLGLIFSFNLVLATAIFGLFSVLIHWVTLYYKASPPRSFFFIMVASLAFSQPFNLQAMPTKVGLIALGTMLACCIGFIYLLIQYLKDEEFRQHPIVRVLTKNSYGDYWEAIIMGVFMTIAFALGHLLQFKNPYWIPISTAAVMQGASRYHIWQRSFHRIVGTLVGVGTSWLVLSYLKAPLALCLTIMIFQFIVEMLVVRQYAFAVIFITPLTILLAELAHPTIDVPSSLILTRLAETCIGSLLGALGGWLLHKEKIRYSTIKEFKHVKDLLNP